MALARWERRLWAEEARVGMKTVITAAQSGIEQQIAVHSMPTYLPNKPDHNLPRVMSDIRMRHVVQVSARSSPIATNVSHVVHINESHHSHINESCQHATMFQAPSLPSTILLNVTVFTSSFQWLNRFFHLIHI